MKFKATRKHTSKPISDAVILSVVGVFFVSLPFVISFTGFDKFRLPKDIFASCFILLIGFLFLVSRRLEIRLRPRSWEFVLGLAILYVGVHSLLGKHPDVSVSGFFQIAYFPLYCSWSPKSPASSFKQGCGFGLLVRLQSMRCSRFCNTWGCSLP